MTAHAEKSLTVPTSRRSRPEAVEVPSAARPTPAHRAEATHPVCTCLRYRIDPYCPRHGDWA